MKRSLSRLDRDIATSLALKSPRLKRIGTIDGLVVYVVSGEWVRNNIDLDFTAGGNSAAYPGYVPKGEIWIDDAMHTLDRLATTFHEIVELRLVQNRGVDYDDAHDVALERERKFRKQLLRDPEIGFSDQRDLDVVVRALAPYAGDAVPSGKRPGRASRTIGSLR